MGTSAVIIRRIKHLDAETWKLLWHVERHQIKKTRGRNPGKTSGQPKNRKPGATPVHHNPGAPGRMVWLSIGSESHSSPCALANVTTCKLRTPSTGQHGISVVPRWPLRGGLRGKSSCSSRTADRHSMLDPNMPPDCTNNVFCAARQELHCCQYRPHCASSREMGPKHIRAANLEGVVTPSRTTCRPEVEELSQAAIPQRPARKVSAAWPSQRSKRRL